MKKILFCLSILSVYSCSNEIDTNINEFMVEEYVETMDDSHVIDMKKALEYANFYFSQTKTRSSASLKMDYVVNKTQTRCGEVMNDTVAYVFNRGNDEGFVIVSSDDRVYPILAHSDNGAFVSEKGSIVDLQFTSLIDEYIEKNANNEKQIVTEEMISSCYSTSIVVDSFSYWSQDYPYNMSLMEEYPGCPVGCVALASGIIMSHCKSKLFYHDHMYNFAKLIRSLEKASFQTTRIVNGAGNVGNGVENITDTTTYSYALAIDTISQLLYWTGKDVNTVYSYTGSSASSSKAFELMKECGYTIADTLGLIPYQNLEAISKMIKGYSMLYMDGRNNGSLTNGHAWVVDAGYYCIEPLKGDTINAYVHCNWGWGGVANGYYTGDIFQIKETNGDRIYDGVRYFAVKKEYKQSSSSTNPSISFH